MLSRLAANLNLDVHTILLLLFVGNLIGIGALLAYRPDIGKQHLCKRFLAAKLFQALAWILLGLRDQIPFVVSANVGNPILFLGFALEASALSTSDERDPQLDTALGVATVCGSIAFELLGKSSGLRVAIASFTTIGLFGIAALTIFRAGSVSRLRRVTAYVYGWFCLVLVFRAVAALLNPSIVSLYSPGIVQSLSFLNLFLFMLVGGVGLLLLLKEDSDHELLKAHQELSAHEALLMNILEASSVAIFLIDKNGRIALANQRTADMFDYPLSDLVGSSYIDHVVESEREGACMALEALQDGDTSFMRLERQYVRRDGSQFWGQLTATRMEEALQQETRLVAVIADITDVKNTEYVIRDMASRDALTGLPNRSSFSDRLQKAIISARREQTRLAVLYLDLDYFKPVNDNYGHAIGDLVLQDVAQRITSCVRMSDTVARLGGDEFIVLLKMIDKDQSAFLIAEKVRHTLSQPFAVEHREISVSCSIGIAIYPDHGIDETYLCDKADAAMYEAKHAGRNTIRLAV